MHQDPSNPSRVNALSGRPRNRVVSFLLFENRLITTASQTDVIEVLPLVLEDGDQIEDIQGGIYCSEEDAAKALRPRLQIQYCYDGFNWTTGSDIVARTTTEPYTLGVHSDRAEYGRMMRICLVYTAAAGTASARVSAHISVKYFGQ